MRHTNYYDTYPGFVPAMPPLPPLPGSRGKEVTPSRAPVPMGHATRRKGHKGMLVLLAFLLLMGGTVAVLLALNYQKGAILQFRPLNPFSQPGYEEPYDDYDRLDEDLSDTTIPRAPTVQDVRLELREAQGVGLSYQEIYRKCIPSMVSILTTSEGGDASGTGVVLTADGYIITNYHVIQGGSSVEVLLFDGRSYSAKLVGGDQTEDLAVLKISATALAPAEFGNSNALQVGDLAFAIGNPLGEELRGTMTDGIVSAIDRDVYMEGNVMTLIQTTAAINPGNSGGALINAYGQVVGITNMKMTSYFETIEGLGFAIPSASTKEVVEELIANGHLTGRPTLGFTGRTLSPEEAEERGVVPGVYISQVERKSDAYAKGLQSGDVITKCNGKEVFSISDINDIKMGFTSGDTLAFQIYREGRYLDLEIRMMERYQMDS